MKDTVIKRAIIGIALKIFPDRDFISLLFWELKLFLLRFYAALSPLEMLKVHNLKKMNELKINLGSGAVRSAGWINIDVQIKLSKECLAHDLRRPLPLKTGCAKYIFSDHVFEHLPFPEAAKSVLGECHRVLEQGGALRIIVPDGERYLRAYATDDWTTLERVEGDPEDGIERVNEVFRGNGFHKYAYDYQTLEKLLLDAGFNAVSRSSFRGGKFEELNIDFEAGHRIKESMYIEAVR